MSKVLVSVAMATYNGEKYLREQLDSIYMQTHDNIEVVVCDDCSRDGTVEILKEYSEKYGLKYFENEKNFGFVKNFERAISLCSGEYIALADQDDVWNSNKIEVLLSNIGSNLLIHSDCHIIDDKNELILPYWKGKMDSHKSYEYFLFSNVVTGCTVLFSKALSEMALPFPEGLAYHDWYLAILAAKEKRIKYIDMCLTRYRQHSSQDTGLRRSSRFRLLKDKIRRLKGEKISRIVDSEKQLKNLKAISKIEKFYKNNKIFSDAVQYFENYLASFIHFKTFFMSIKYRKLLYSGKNYFFVKNIFNDIVG